MHRGASSTVVNRPREQSIPDSVDLEWIHAHQQGTEPGRVRMRRRCVHDRLDHMGLRVDLADPGDPFVGVQAQDERVLAAVGDRRIEGIRLPQHDRFNLGDPHLAASFGPCSGSTYEK